MENKDIAEMDSATSRWPDNLDTASVLAIRSPCGVTDAYQLICDRKNIRTLIVSGREYTAQEVRNMSFGDRLGNDRGPEPTREPAWVLTPAPTQGGIIPGAWMASRPTQLNTFTSPEYRRYMEQLMRDNPNWNGATDVPAPTPERSIVQPAPLWTRADDPLLPPQTMPTEQISPAWDFYAEAQTPW